MPRALQKNEVTYPNVESDKWKMVQIRGFSVSLSQRSSRETPQNLQLTTKARGCVYIYIYMYTVYIATTYIYICMHYKPRLPLRVVVGLGEQKKRHLRTSERATGDRCRRLGSSSVSKSAPAPGSCIQRVRLVKALRGGTRVLMIPFIGRISPINLRRASATWLFIFLVCFVSRCLTPPPPDAAWAKNLWEGSRWDCPGTPHLRPADVFRTSGICSRVLHVL